MDIVFIQDLKIETIIGVFEWERKNRQWVSFDIEMSTDIQNAALTDSIENALDYHAVTKGVIRLVENAEVLLVETLAEKVANYIIKEFSVTRIKLKLTKPQAIKEAQGVGVIIERSA